MKPTQRHTLPALTKLVGAQWLAKVRPYFDSEGFYDQVGPNHEALFLDRGRTLLVTFESLAQINRLSAKNWPLGYEVAADKGWSLLTMVANHPTWFRDADVYTFFDRVSDEGFFDEFDQVVFFGAGMNGYAAAAYSVTSPGCTVLALAPQATLDPRRSEWDTRFTRMRSISFDDRYGYAPDMIEAAQSAYIFYDPEEIEDSMHASLFGGTNVERLRLRGGGKNLDFELQAMGLLHPIIEMACEGTLTPLAFHTLYRKRRGHLPYLSYLMQRLDDDGRDQLVMKLCQNVTRRMRAPRFKTRLEKFGAAAKREIEPEPAE